MKKFKLHVLCGWMDFTGTAQINHWEVEENCSNFGDPDLIFKIRGGQRRLKKCLVLIIYPEGID